MRSSLEFSYFVCRLGLSIAYLYSGIAKCLDFSAAIAEQAHFGLQPAALFAAATILVQLGGSLLLLFGAGRWRAVSAAALAGFTLLATLIGHRFWAETGVDRFRDLNSFLEHFGLIGGLFLVALPVWFQPAALAHFKGALAQKSE